MKSRKFEITPKKIAIGAVVAVGVGLVFRQIFKGSRLISFPTRKTVLPTTNEGLTMQEADMIARGQFSSMNKLGTDDIEGMIRPLESLTGNDLKKVYNSFGLRCYNGYTECVGVDRFLNGRDLDLFGWYLEELNQSELNQMREVWRKTGMNLSF